MDDFVTPYQAKRIFRVCDNTLRRWVEEGKIDCYRAPGNGTHRRYNINKLLGKEPEQRPRRKICYTRVSSSGQKEDLERQIKYLKTTYPGYEYIKDIGSGLNFKRKGFSSILESAIAGDVEELVVTHRDRLCRFGFELVEWMVSKYSNGKIVVLEQDTSSPTEELTKDLISIITVFSSRLYGLRRNRRKIVSAIKDTQDPSDTKRTGEGPDHTEQSGQ